MDSEFSVKTGKGVGTKYETETSSEGYERRWRCKEMEMSEL